MSGRGLSARLGTHIQKVAIAPAGSSINIGWRTGVDVKAGKNIRIDAEGFENFSDYFTSPEPDQASDGSVTISPISTRRKQVLRASNASTTQSSLSFTPVTEPTVSSSSFATTGNTGNEISSSQTDHRPAASSAQSGSTPGVTRESSEQAENREVLKTSISSLVEIPKAGTDQQLLVAPSPERFGTRKRLTYSGTPVSSATTLEVTTGIAAATSSSTDAELQTYAERLKAVLQEQTNTTVNKSRLSSATVDTAPVESIDSVSFKQPELGVAFGSRDSSQTSDDHQCRGAVNVYDAVQGSNCLSRTKNDRHSISKSSRDKLKCDIIDSSRTVDKIPSMASGTFGVEEMVHYHRSNGVIQVMHDSAGCLQTGEDRQSSGIASVENGLRDNCGSSSRTDNHLSNSVTGVGVVSCGVTGSSHSVDDRPSSGVTSLEDVRHGKACSSHTSSDHQSRSAASIVGAMQGIGASSLQLASGGQFDSNADDDDFEILSFHDVGEKPRANALPVRKLPIAGGMSSGVQKRKRSKASKSETSKTIGGLNNVMNSCSPQKQLAFNGRQTKSEELATSNKSDHVNHNDSSVHAKKSKRSVMCTKQRSRKLSVYDLEPDDDEEFNGTQSLTLTKYRLDEKRSSRIEQSAKPSSKSPVRVVIPQLTFEKKSAKSVKGQKSEKSSSGRAMSKSPSVDVGADKKKKKHKSIVSLKSQKDFGSDDADSTSDCRAINKKSSVKRPIASTTDSGVPRKVSKRRTEDSNCMSMVNPISASVSCASGPLAARQSESVATLSSAPGFFPANFMTSTPLPSRQVLSRQRILTSSSQSVVHAPTMLTDVEETSGRTNINTRCMPVATNDTCNIVNSLKRKTKKLPMLSVVKRRKTASCTAKKNSKRSVANSITSTAKHLMSTSFSPEVDRHATVDATGNSCLPRYSTASPLHYFEMTEGESQATSATDTLHKKIIVPTESRDGLRRSSRTRVQTLDWFRGERIRYKPNKSGLVVAGIDSPKPDPQKVFGKRLRQEIRKQTRQEKRMKPRLPQTPRDLSVHVTMPPSGDEELTSDPAIPVLNCDVNAEVLMECIKVRDQFNILNSTGEPAANDDHLTICKPLRHPSFCSGFLTIRPLQIKEMQYVQNDTLVFCVMRGKVELTIHRTQQVIESSDMFCVPKGNRYSIRNLRNDEAKLFFVQLKN